MELTKEMVEAIVNDFFARSAVIRAAGGVPLADVYGGKAARPYGWPLDEQALFFVPPNLNLDGGKC